MGHQRARTRVVLAMAALGALLIVSEITPARDLQIERIARSHSRSVCLTAPPAMRHATSSKSGTRSEV